MKELYLKSDWEFPPAHDDIEDCLGQFEYNLQAARARYNRIHPSNILPSQWHLINQMKDNDDFIIVEVDKNCGGCFLLRDTYNTRGISEHLGNTNVYQPLTRDEAISKLSALKCDLICFAAKWRAR